MQRFSAASKKKKENLFKHLFLRHSWATSNVITWRFLVAWGGFSGGISLVMMGILGVSF